MFRAERCHCSAGCVVRPLRDGKTDARIKRLRTSHSRRLAGYVPKEYGLDGAMTPALSIRLAGVDDADAIGRFQTRAWEQSYRGLVPDKYLDGTSWSDRAQRWLTRMASGQRTVWIAFAGSTLLGVASTSITPPGRPDLPQLELASLYVESSWHGRGIAPILLQRAIGKRPAHLWVFDANTRAQRFYAKHGFITSCERQVDLGTALVETRWVRPNLSSTTRDHAGA
ncbi:GNAT family N-acetyltransferase [Cnuibacter physcomitrellae]|uniref:GNAT family N-acetyltransferase n=1 Tax=Cnuibacter physcomitrellae TaxID=1619308 RepID=UPI0035C66DA4